MPRVTAYLIGLLFGTGIALSGMIDPAKVLNFFDLAGHWDPSLAFVMAGALAVTAAGYRLVLRPPAPILADRFHLPEATAIDARLIGGAAIFGVGWGIAGFCPGGALPALGTGRADVALFVGALIAGILATRAVLARRRPGKG
ncbi:MAG: YeeE/YedE family protein [Amaricoccus sp.]|uniref:DUF6691 family protein n=1 Tax=Amaricoccus sp. TaxID=1872485 RepID=UPI0039E5DE80